MLHILKGKLANR